MKAIINRAIKQQQYMYTIMHACARAMFVFLDICISLIRSCIKRYTKGLHFIEMTINHTIKYVKLFFRCIKFSLV